jgi:putative multiple sugar transport system substrate-binding protein
MKPRITLLLAVALLALPLPAFASGNQESRLAIGVILPTKDEPRWVQDQGWFQDAFNRAGYSVQVLFSQGDSAKEKANVESLIANGVKVIILCPQDPSAAASAVDEAHAAGVKVISYDRLVQDSASVDYYVTFDSAAVGAAAGSYLVSMADGKDNNLYLYAETPSDNEASLFFQGAWSILQPKIEDGTFSVVNSSEAAVLKKKTSLTAEELGRIMGQVTTKGNAFDAQAIAEANLAAATVSDKGTVFICAPRDETARAIADTFAADKAVSTFYITGQGAEKESIQYIIDGKQSMTVLKDGRVLVNDAITAAVTFVKGRVPEKTITYNNGLIDVPSRPSAIVAVTRENVKAAIVDSGYWPASDFSGL